MPLKRARAFFKKKLPTELLLLRRLKTLGICLFFVSAGFLYQAISFSLAEKDIHSISLDPDIEPELCPHDAFNFFAISFLFAAIGAVCLFVSWKRMRTIRSRKE